MKVGVGAHRGVRVCVGVSASSYPLYFPPLYSSYLLSLSFFVFRLPLFVLIVFHSLPGLVEAKVIVPQPEVPPPTVPMDYNWARELGLIRKPASFMSSICDERGQELLYAGMPITDVFQVRSSERGQ